MITSLKSNAVILTFISYRQLTASSVMSYNLKNVLFIWSEIKIFFHSFYFIYRFFHATMEIFQKKIGFYEHVIKSTCFFLLSFLCILDDVGGSDMLHLKSALLNIQVFVNQISISHKLLMLIKLNYVFMIYKHHAHKLMARFFN